MAYGSEAFTVQGDCVKKLQSSTLELCLPLRRLTVHTRFGSPFSNDFIGTYGCGKAYPFTPDGTQIVNFTTPPTYTMSNGNLYGFRKRGVMDVYNPGGTMPVDPDPFVIQDVYFKSTELNPWKERSVGFFSNMKTSGPPISKFHMAIPVRRRLKKPSGPSNTNYQGRYDWNFVDADQKIYNQSDWLGPLHPAHYFWTNVGIPEPFNVTDYYQQSNTSPPAAYLNQYRIPFCAPMKIYDVDGVHIGNYTGYTAVHYFSLAFVHHADATQRYCLPNGTSTITNPFLPENYHVNVTPPQVRPKIKHQNQLFQMESHFFMIAETLPGKPVIKSPKLGTMRWWHYADPTVNPWPCNPYMYIYLPHTGIWKFGLRFNHYDNTDHTDILFGLPMISTFITP